MAALLDGRDPERLRLADAVQESQLLGSLELAGAVSSLDDVRAARRGAPASAAAAGLVRAVAAVDPHAVLTVEALQAWHRALGLGAGYRARDRTRADGPAPAPVEFISSRLAILQEWLSVESSRELRPAQAGALVLARVVEIAPFEDGNGRVGRLAASHLMVRAGARSPVLVGSDRPRLEACLRAAFQLNTEPLTALLEEAAERALDIMLRALPGPEG